MFPFLKYLSRSVHEEYQHDQPPPEVSEASAETGGTCTRLTVWRKSLLVSCEGFTVIDSEGNLVYRVDNYAGSRPDELILMDKDGKSVLLMQLSKKITLVDRWLVYEVEGEDNVGANTDTPTNKLPRRPIWCIKKHININILDMNSNVLAYVYYGLYDKKYAYVVKGSYLQRSCKVLDGSSERVMAEIKKKEAKIRGVSLGLDVFVLVVNPGFDPSFAMAVVLLLDKMFS